MAGTAAGNNRPFLKIQVCLPFQTHQSEPSGSCLHKCCTVKDKDSPKARCSSDVPNKSRFHPGIYCKNLRRGHTGDYSPNTRFSAMWAWACSSSSKKQVLQGLSPLRPPITPKPFPGDPAQETQSLPGLQARLAPPCLKN